MSLQKEYLCATVYIEIYVNEVAEYDDAKHNCEQQCILPKQQEQITKALQDCQNLLGAWVKSDNKRYVEGKSS